MLGKVFNNLFGTPTPAGDNIPADDRVPFAVLLVRLARTDYEYVMEERAQIVEILQARYNLDDVATELLVEQAERTEAEPHDNVYFTKQIKNTVALDQRGAVMEDLWLLAVADGRRDDEENGFLRLICSLLGLTDPESAAARHRALARIKGQ